MVVVFFLAGLAISPAVAQHPYKAIRVGTNVWPGYEPFYLARELGLFHGRNIRLVEFLSASEVLRAFRNQELEAAALTLDEALMLVAARIPITVVLVTDISRGGDAILAKPEIKEFQELKGKRVGVEGSAVGAYLLARALQMRGLSATDLRVEQLEVNEHEAAFEADKLDAVVTFEPVRSRLLRKGARELFSSRDIPNEIIDVLVVRQRALAEHAGQFERLVQGWFAALGYLRTKPQDAAAIIAERLKMSAEEVLSSYAGMELPGIKENRRLLDGDPPPIARTARSIETFMLRNKLLAEKSDFRGVFDHSLLARIRP